MCVQLINNTDNADLDDAERLCTAAAVGMLTSLALILILLIHHYLKHSNPTSEDFLQDPVDQWFQWSDVCNWSTCSHEMWVLGFLFVMVAAFVVMVVQCPNNYVVK